MKAFFTCREYGYETKWNTNYEADTIESLVSSVKAQMLEDDEDEKCIEIAKVSYNALTADFDIYEIVGRMTVYQSERFNSNSIMGSSDNSWKGRQ